MNWNSYINPISTRLRDEDALMEICENNNMIYHPPTGSTAVIIDVYIVDVEENIREAMDSCMNPFDVTNEAFVDDQEDRYLHYLSDEQIYEDFSIALDEEGWVWADEHPDFSDTNLTGTVNGGTGEATATVTLNPGGGSLETHQQNQTR